MARPMIEVRNVTKVFDLAPAYADGIKAFLRSLPKRLFHGFPRHVLVALDDVSFDVHPGETFGVIGRNGAGKSTLLSLIAGVLRPTSGSIAVHGIVSPLLELGIGFAPDLSGRQNVILKGVLLGLTRREIEGRQEEIIEFSGVRHFIDQPLKHYSSGMQARLGFAIAIHTDPQLLLCDEIFAVGDKEFQQKCHDKVEELRRSGITTVIVSHSLQRIQECCDRAALIDKGKLVKVGDPKEVAEQYDHMTEAAPASSSRPEVGSHD